MALVAVALAAGFLAGGSSAGHRRASTRLALQSPVAQRASAAATSYLHGGIVLEVVRESGGRAAYGVYVQERDGQVAEVLLGKAYGVLPQGDGGAD